MYSTILVKMYFFAYSNNMMSRWLLYTAARMGKNTESYVRSASCQDRGLNTGPSEYTLTRFSLLLSQLSYPGDVSLTIISNSTCGTMSDLVLHCTRTLLKLELGIGRAHRLTSLHVTKAAVHQGCPGRTQMRVKQRA